MVIIINKLSYEKPKIHSSSYAISILLIPDSLSQSLKYTSTDDALMVVKGTSTLHDWELRSETMMSEVAFITGNGGAFDALESVIFILKKTP